ncbi:MAG: hypothetical protein ACJ8EB_06545 [Allosphingosinicella sp.]
MAMLQAIIVRLATASASCKTWCLTLVGALLSFAAGMKSPQLAGFAIVPIVLFTYLDASYLAQEQAYRHLFAKVIVPKIRDGTYSLYDCYEANAPLCSGGVARAVFSWSVGPFYLSLLLAYAVAMCSGWVAAPAAQAAPAAGARG